MHLRLPSDVPSRALRRKAHRAPASGEGLVAPDQRPCLLGVGFPSSGPRVWTFTSSLWVMPLAPVPRPGPLRVPRGRRAGLSRPRRRSRRPIHRGARDTHPFARVVAHSDGPTRRPGRRGAASWPRAVLAPSLHQPLSPPFHVRRHTLDFARVTPTTPSRVRRTRTRVRSSSGV